VLARIPVAAMLPQVLTSLHPKNRAGLRGGAPRRTGAELNNHIYVIINTLFNHIYVIFLLPNIHIYVIN